MKKTTLLVLSVLFILVSCNSNGSSSDKDNGSSQNNKDEIVYEDVNSQEFKFEAKFPGKLTVEKIEEIEDFFNGNIQVFSSEYEDIAYIIAPIKFNEQLSEIIGNFDSIIATTIDNTIANYGFELVKKEEQTFDGIAATYYEGEGTNDSEEFYLAGLVFYDNLIMYSITITCKKDNWKKSIYDDFMNNFKLIK